jgi:cytochrome oxidase Cu insertion factor (SCO1/SenC/PrrC family)
MMMSCPPRLSMLAAFGLLVATTAFAQDKGKPAPESQTGLRIGEKAPAFALKDQEGIDRSLEELLKKGKVALVFYRSADW